MAGNTENNPRTHKELNLFQQTLPQVSPLTPPLPIDTASLLKHKTKVGCHYLPLESLSWNLNNFISVFLENSSFSDLFFIIIMQADN